jgi:threonine/homoserine/homoserine lactone efflux protein
VFGFSLAVSCGAVISPGPVTAIVITEAPCQGWRVGLLVALGNALLEFLMVLLISFGGAAVLDSPSIQRLIAIGGGLVMFAIGANYLYSAWRGSMRLPEPQEDTPLRSASGLFGLGILTMLSNPFWFAW